MATFNRKYPSVEAVQHFGQNKTVVSSLKNEQVAHSGDFLVIDPDAVAAIRAAEKAQEVTEGLEPGKLAGTFGNRGTVYVISKADFLRDFDATDATPAAVGEQGFDVPSEIEVPAPAETTPVTEPEPAKQ